MNAQTYQWAKPETVYEDDSVENRTGALIWVVLGGIIQLFIGAALQPHIPVITASLLAWVVANWPGLLLALAVWWCLAEPPPGKGGDRL